MTKRTLGIFAVVGSALGAWWLARQRRGAVTRSQRTPAGAGGTVLAGDLPTPSDIDAII